MFLSANLCAQVPCSEIFRRVNRFQARALCLHNCCKIRSWKQNQPNTFNYYRTTEAPTTNHRLYCIGEKSTVQLKCFLSEHHWLLLRTMRHTSIYLLFSKSPVLPVFSSFTQISLGEHLIAVWWEVSKPVQKLQGIFSPAAFIINIYIMKILFPPCLIWQPSIFASAWCKAESMWVCTQKNYPGTEGTPSTGTGNTSRSGAQLSCSPCKKCY